MTGSPLERGRWDRMGAVEQFDYAVGLEAEIRRLRQGLWDVAAAAGSDTDGDETPDHMTYPDIVDYALREVRELRETYDGDSDAAELLQRIRTYLAVPPDAAARFEELNADLITDLNDFLDAQGEGATL